MAGRSTARGRAAAAAVLTVVSAFGVGAAPPAAAQDTPGGPPATAAAPAPALAPSTLPPSAPVDPTITPMALAPAERDADGVRAARGSGPLKLVAVTWTGANPDTVELRSTDAVGHFGAWTPLDPAGTERDDQPAGRTTTGGTEPVWVGDRTAVEVRALRGGRSVTGEVGVVRIDPGTSPNDATIGRSRAAAAPAYVTRAQWGADERLRTWNPEILPAIKAVTIHHTAGANDYGPGDSAAIVRGIYAYHARTQGWGDIGYNALVDKFGTIFEGRYGGMDKAVVAAHAGGFNRETWGIGMMGNHVSVAPTVAETESVSRLAAWKLHGLDPDQRIGLTSTGGGTAKFARGQVATVPRLFGHRDVGNTVCPGDAGYGALGLIRARIKALSAGAPAASTPTSTGGSTDVRDLWGPGEPVLREGPTADGRGRYNEYAQRSVYWTPTTGGWEIYGAIRDRWRATGAERSPQGYPTSNEYDVPGGRQQNFEHGVLRWLAATGAVFTPTR